MFISNIATNIVLPLYLEYDGLCFPNNQWTDFADVNLVTACDPVVKLWLRDQDVELVDFMAVYK